MFPCCPLPKIPFQCPGGPAEPLCPTISLHPQEDQTAGGITGVSEQWRPGMEVRMGTLSLLLLFMCPDVSDTPQKGQSAVAILWLKVANSCIHTKPGFHNVISPRYEELGNLVKVLQ